MRLVTESAKYDYKAEEVLKFELKNISNVVGAIEVMSKGNILRLIRMQSSLRFMADHRFYSKFVEACKFFNLEN